MEENKQAILDALKVAINLTRAGDDVTKLEYDSEKELVNVHFRNEKYPARQINVAMDSGYAMLKDVMNHIDIG